MDRDRYTIVINGTTGLLDVSEPPFCHFDLVLLADPQDRWAKSYN